MKSSPMAARQPRVGSCAALVAWFAAAGAPSALAAQVAEEPTFQLGRVANLAVDEEGRLLGLGGNWEARFDAQGALFVPVPARVPARPLDLRLGAVRAERGGVALELRAAPPEARGDTAVYTRAPGVEEHFTARPEGLFHSLWFERPLGSGGDLVVTVALGGSLRLEGARDSHGTHRFGGDDGGVHYGELTGIDATGRSTPGEVRMVPGGLQLVLPAAFVDTATWPVLLDPLVGTTFPMTDPLYPETFGGDLESDSESDVAYDASTDTYLLVWRRLVYVGGLAGTAVTTIRGQRFDSQGQPLGGVLAVSSVDTSRGAKAVNVNFSNRFGVAWVQDFFGETQVRFRAVNAGSGTMSNSLYVVGLPAGQITNVALTGEWSTSLSDTPQAWAFWASPSGIRGARILVPSSPTQPTVAATFTAQGGVGLSEPASPRTVSQAGRIGLVWTRAAGENREVWGTVLNRSGAALHAQRWISFGQTKAQHPSIEGGGTGPTNFLVTWNEVDESCSFLGCSDIFQLFRATLRSGTQLDVDLPIAVSEPNLPVRAEVGMGWRNQRTLLAYSSGSELRLLGVDTPTGALLEGPLVVDVASGPNPFGQTTELSSPAVAMHASGGAFDSTAGLVVYARKPPTVLFPVSGTIRGQLVETFPTSATAQNLGGGCGMPGASYVLNGAPALGNGTLQARLLFPGTGTSLAIFNIAPPAPAYPWLPCGTCQWVPFFSTIPVPGNSQLITVDIPIPGDPALAGIAVDTQWTTVKLGAEPCALAPGLAASNIQRLTLH